jgi:hypothetical protein
MFYGVFELPLPRNAQKRTNTNSRKKKSDGGWLGLRFSKCTGGVRRFFLAAPRTKVTCVCCSAKQKVATCSIFTLSFLSIFRNACFGRFVTMGVQKHGITNSERIHLGSSQKMWLFFPSVFFLFSLGCLVRFFYRVFRSFVTRGVQKRDKKFVRKSPQSQKK